MKRQNSNFTLFEILLVIALLAMATSVIGFGFMQERGQQQFNNEVTALQQKLQAAELLMQLHHETVTVVIQGTKVTIQTDIPLTTIFNHIFNEHEDLPSLSSLTFITPEGRRVEGNFSLVFSAIKQSIPRGTILITRGKEQKSIVLTGYVQPITVENGVKLVKPEEESQDYPRIVEEEWEKRGEKKVPPLHTP